MIAPQTARPALVLAALALGCDHVATRPAAPLVAVEIAGPETPSAPLASAPTSDVSPKIAPQPAPTGGEPAPVPGALALISILGTAADADPLRSVEALHAAGTDAVPLLIAELQVIDPERWGARGMHVIWCIRALRSLTGENFVFKTSMPLSRSAASFLDAKEPLPYFAEWMSHARIYVAPRDVQRQVIKAWKDWFAAKGTSFTVKKYDGVRDWYF